MEVQSKNTICCSTKEEEGNRQRSLRKHLEADVAPTPARLSSARLSAASAMSVLPSGAESPWALSPMRPSPSPSLLHHCIASLHRLDGAIASIAVSKTMVFTGSCSSRVRVWRHPECSERGFLRTSSGNVGAVLALDNILFSAHKDHKIRIWTVSVADRLRYKKLSTLPRRTHLLPFIRPKCEQKHRDVITCLAYHQADGLLYSASWDRTVKAWKVAEKRCVDSFIAHEERVNSIVVNQDDGFVFTGSCDGCIKVWRRMYGEISHALTMILRFQPSPVNALAVGISRGSGSFLYSGSSDGLVNYWGREPTSGRYKHGGFLQGHRFRVLCLVAVERFIFSGSEDTTIRVWSREEGSGSHVCLAVLEGHRGPVKCLAACVEMQEWTMGFLIYSASSDGTLKGWRIKVLADNKKGAADDAEKNGLLLRMAMNYAMSPVLSPSWMEKKLEVAGSPLRQ